MAAGRCSTFLAEVLFVSYGRIATNVTNPRMLPLGYEAKSGLGISASGHTLTTDMATVTSAFAVIRSGYRRNAEVRRGSLRVGFGPQRPCGPMDFSEGHPYNLTCRLL